MEEEEDEEPKPVSIEADGADTEQEWEDKAKEKGENGEKGAVAAESEKFDGDHVLMRSALLMYEALVSKEVAQVVVEGDIGRVYEGIKARR